MQRRKMFVAGVGALALVGGLAGCSNASSTDANTLTFTAATDYREAFEAVIANYEDANPEVTVDVTFAATSDIESTMPTQLGSGAGPDLVSVQPGIGGNLISVGSLASQGYLEDLSGQSWAGDISDSLRTSTDLDGATYMYPGVLQPLGAFYNMDAVGEAGLVLPESWTDVLAFCADAASAGKTAFSLGLQDAWVTQLIPYALAATEVYGVDQNWNEQLIAGDVTFPDSAWEGVLTQYLEMNDAGCFTPSANGVSFDNSLPPVAAGDALGIVQVGGVFSNLQGQNPEVTYALLPLPANDDPSSTQIAASPGVGVGVNANSARKDLAIDFVNFFAQPEQINLFAETLGGVVPALPNDDFQVPELLGTFNDLVVEGKAQPFPDTGWPNPRIQNAHLVGIQNMFLGTETPEQVLTDMQSALD
ncbi:ABC transporter substrate-binding protein [Microbacterium chocolatum]|uniref:ABC transporter substrate-binding protein n=1 Tax=Microbacterium aurantiacum TaxID=162393 RepID=UPI00338DEA59